MDDIVSKAKKSGYFMFIMGKLSDNYQLNMKIDRNKAFPWYKISDITNNLTTLFSESHINYFSMDNYNYKVIPQIENSQRLNPNQLNNIYLTTQSEAQVPLSVLCCHMKLSPQL